MNELTLEEVLEALKHCANYKNRTESCIGCPLYGQCDTNTLESLALAVILKYQDENAEKDIEIAKLTERLDREVECREYLFSQIVDLRDENVGLRAHLDVSVSKQIQLEDEIGKLRAERDKAQATCVQMSKLHQQELGVVQAKTITKVFDEIEREIKNHGITYANRKIAELRKKLESEVV